MDAEISGIAQRFVRGFRAFRVLSFWEAFHAFSILHYLHFRENPDFLNLGFRVQVGGRDVLLVQAPALWAHVALPLAASEVAARSPLIRRLRMKLVQRVGLAHLPPRVATWRYQVRPRGTLTDRAVPLPPTLPPPGIPAKRKMEPLYML